MKKLSAFLIDDDYPTNVYNEIIIQDSGLFGKWSIFQSASKALDTLKSTNEPPDIILLDINMPIMNGWDFLNQYELFEDDKCENIIMLTTSLSKYDQDKSKHYSNIKGFKEKPLNVDMLREIVNDIILTKNELEVNI